MPSVCFYFEVHQPCRLRSYDFFSIGSHEKYADDGLNRDVLLKVAEKCYLPMNALLLRIIRRFHGDFRCSFSITGTVIDQFMEFAPHVLESFQELAATGCVEFLDETDNHSLSFLFDEREFRKQVGLHRTRMKELFGQEPTAFRNTELIYNNYLAHLTEDMGYKAILAEGADRILGWRSPCYMYAPAGGRGMKLLLKSYSLSDDIAFRFSNHLWPAFPLMADTYAGWLHNIQGHGNIIGLFMDYETFGEHQWADTGIFDFMDALPGLVLKNPTFDFATISEAADRYPAAEEIDVPVAISWADEERDLSAWMGNDLQKDALSALFRCRDKVEKLNNPEVNKIWSQLQTSDHFYYMSTKCASDGDVHKYFSPYGSPWNAYTNYMNILADFRLLLRDAQSRGKKEFSPVWRENDLSDGLNTENEEPLSSLRESGTKDALKSEDVGSDIAPRSEKNESSASPQNTSVGDVPSTEKSTSQNIGSDRKKRKRKTSSSAQDIDSGDTLSTEKKDSEAKSTGSVRKRRKKDSSTQDVGTDAPTRKKRVSKKKDVQ